MLNSINGYQCFIGYHAASNTMYVVMWNPSENVEPVNIAVNPNEGYTHTVVGSGVCPVTGQLKLVKISVMEDFHGRPTMWDVDYVLPLTGEIEWINVHRDMQPFRSCKMESAKVCENGVIYFRAFDGPIGNRTNFFISFDLERMMFGEVPLPWSLPSTCQFIQSVNVNGSLGLLKYQDDGSCDVWTKREGATGTLFQRFCNFYGVYETFTNIRTIRVEGQDLYGKVLGFRNNGDVVLELDVSKEVSRIVVYEQGHIRDVEIRGRPDKFFARQL